jgi:hypothetical protein
MSRKVFWISAFGAALGFAGVVALLFPYGALGIHTAAEVQRAWLLTVFTGGAMAICFGVSGLLGMITPITFGDVAQAGSVIAAIETRQEERRQLTSPFYNFAGWTVSTGAFLVLIYFAGWISLGG